MDLFGCVLALEGLFANALTAVECFGLLWLPSKSLKVG